MPSFSRQQNLVLIISILASFVSFLDGFIITVALPAIEQELGGGLITQQWVVNAYFLTLSALMLLAGSLSDIFGRVRILKIGIIGFGITSLLCAIAPSALFLIIARLLQGAAGALLVPSSLALIMASFSGNSEGQAIGRWTAWTTIAAVVGPLLGGLLVDTGSWRLIFAINIIPIAITLYLMRRLESVPHGDAKARIDTIGALLGALGLGAITYALIEQPNVGWESMSVLLPLIVGIITLCIFIWYEYRTKHPMLPLKLFTIRNFGIGNVATLFIYGGLSVSTFLITIFLQQVAGYSALTAGLVFLPITVLMFLLSSYFGKLSATYGPRLFMSLGPITAGCGFLLMLGMDETAHYWSEVLPGVLLFGLGLSITVAPLTSAILGAIPKPQSGIASAINNAVARLAGLIAIAMVGIVIGPELTVGALHAGLWFIALLLFIGGGVSAVGIEKQNT